MWLMVLKIYEMTYTVQRDTLEEAKEAARESIDHWKKAGVKYDFKPEFYEAVRRKEVEESFSYT